MTKLLLLTLLALGYQSASAQYWAESFGTGGNAFTMDFIPIVNPGNAADTTCTFTILGACFRLGRVGSVAYIYNLGKNEVSRDMITKANSAGSLGITMFDMGGYSGNGVDKPATGVSWYEAAKFVNWLNTSTVGGTAAYKFDISGNFQLWSAGDAGYNANNPFRNSLAKYVIASTDEWYKGAYGKADGSWSNFPNGTDIAPTPVPGGTAPNTAVFDGQTGPADINNAGGLSSFLTMGQGGNVYEWTESAHDGINDTVGELRGLRGGSWSSGGSDLLKASFGGIADPSTKDGVSFGFRVAIVPSLSASVPEPSTGLLVLLGLSGLLLKRRKTGTL